MGRLNRYKKNHMAPHQVSFWEERLFSSYLSLIKQWQNKAISDSELCAQYLYLFYQEFLGSKMIGARGPELFTDIQCCQSPYLSFWNQQRVRGVKIAVNRSLLAWHLGLYPLQLFFTIPTPLEVLAQQAQGYRPVSLIFNSTSSSHSDFALGQRDPWSFLVHDLIHADQFFFQNQMQQEQQILCHLFLELYHRQFWQHLWQRYPQAQSESEYLFSDMNAHPIHLLKVFKAILLRYQTWEDFLEVLPSLQHFRIKNAQQALMKLSTTEDHTHNHYQLLEALQPVRH